MTKKRKRTKGGASGASKRAAAAPEDTAGGAASSANDAAPTDDAAEELAEAVPTRFSERRALSPDEAAIAELEESEPTRSGEPALEATMEELAEAARRASEDHRFDFGGESLTGPDVPPDPGSADGTSPRLQSIVESLLFAADRPLGLRQLADLVEESEVERIRGAVLAIEQSWRDRGVQLQEVAGGYQFRTHPANAGWVQRLLQQKPVRLSRQLLETLAICAYRQPITRPEIDEIRGVDSGGTLKTLMDRALVRILGKKEEPGRPLLYGTSKEFLEFFSLRDLKDLPTLREYHELSEEHRAQVAALEGKAPAGAILPEGEIADDELTDALPKLSRLEIAAPKEDAEELAEIDRLIRTAGASIATDSDLTAGEPPGPHDAPDPDELAVTGKFEAKPRAAGEFDDDQQRTRTFGDPIAAPADAAPPAGEFEREDPTGLRPSALESSLIDGRDPEKEPAA